VGGRQRGAGDLEAEFCCHAGNLSGMIALNAANADEGIAALFESFWNKISVSFLMSLFGFCARVGEEMRGEGRTLVFEFCSLQMQFPSCSLLFLPRWKPFPPTPVKYEGDGGRETDRKGRVT
jgi:hypothetical protein